MMSNVIAFPEPKTRQTVSPVHRTGPVTLFVHVKRATLIAHLTGRTPSVSAKDERVGKN